MRRSALAVLAVAIALLGAGASADAAAVTPVEGPWQATTSDGLPVSFEVSAGRILYPRYSFKWGFCGTFGSGIEPSVPIDAEGHWSSIDPRGPIMEATFVAPGRAEGTIIAPSRETPGCPETKATFVAEPGGMPFDPGPAVIRTRVGAPKARASHPRAITLGRHGSFRLYDLRWHHWGKPTAHATGRAYIRRPCRGCRRGPVWRPRVRVRLNELIQENGFRLYLDLRYELLGPLPPHFRRVKSLYF